MLKQVTEKGGGEVKHYKNGEDKCLVTHCQSTKLYSRGLCGSHYNKANQLVHQGSTTWKKMEKLGVVNVSRRIHGRKPVVDFFLGKK